MSRRALAVLAAAVVLAACSSATDPLVTVPAAVSSPPAAPTDDVDLRLYFRRDDPQAPHLVAVVREVPISDDLPRRALELLLAGPVEGDGNVGPVLPASTQVLGLSVADGTAHVDLSPEVITDAGMVGRAPHNEVLALAALANTLTEFPTVQRVVLTIAGHSEGEVDGVDVDAFWGAWGLPPTLLRDDTLIGPPVTGGGVPDLAQFSVDPQRVGESGTPGVHLTNLRAHSRTAHLRVTVDAEQADAGSGAVLPHARATLVGGRVVLEIDALAYGPEPPAGRLSLSDAAFTGVEVTENLPGSLRVVVDAGEPRAFRLHTLPSPPRVVLDVRR